MRISVCLLVLLLPSIILAQVSSNQQKSLNAYIEYANQSADEVIEVVNSIIEYYPQIGSDMDARFNWTVTMQRMPKIKNKRWEPLPTTSAQHLGRSKSLNKM